MSKMDSILKDFGDMPEHVMDDVVVLANVLSGSLPALKMQTPRWSEVKQRNFIRSIWRAEKRFARDILNQSFDGVATSLETYGGYGEDYTVALLDYITDTNRCQPQIYEGYGNPSQIAVGAKVVLAIYRQEFEGQAGEVIAASHGKWLVAFPCEDGVIHGRYSTNELLNLGDYREKVQNSRKLD